MGTNTYFGTVYSGSDLEILSTGRMAVMGERPDNGQVRTLVRNGVASVFLYGPEHTGMDLVETAAGELAVLGVDRVTGAIRVRHVDPVGGAVTDIPY